MAQEVKAQEAPAEESFPIPVLRLTRSFKNGLGLTEGFVVTDTKLVEDMQALVLDKHRSQGTQVPESQPSASTDSAVTNEQLKLASKQSTTRETKAAKPTSGSCDISSQPEKVSKEIKERFIALNVKYGREETEDFRIYLECRQFEPSDVKVSIEGDFLVVRCKHQFTFDDHGMVWREFKRRWLIPEDVKRDQLSCLFDIHNILVIKAPRKPTAIIVPVEIEEAGWRTSDV